jgi:hypothetical protein
VRQANRFGQRTVKTGPIDELLCLGSREADSLNEETRERLRRAGALNEPPFASGSPNASAQRPTPEKSVAHPVQVGSLPHDDEYRQPKRTVNSVHVDHVEACYGNSL